MTTVIKMTKAVKATKFFDEHGDPVISILGDTELGARALKITLNDFETMGFDVLDTYTRKIVAGPHKTEKDDPALYVATGNKAFPFISYWYDASIKLWTAYVLDQSMCQRGDAQYGQAVDVGNMIETLTADAADWAHEVEEEAAEMARLD